MDEENLKVNGYGRRREAVSVSNSARGALTGPE